MPLFADSKPVLEQIIKNRDSIGKAYIRGNDTETMYMITEAARTPSVSIKSIDGKTATLDFTQLIWPPTRLITVNTFQ